MTRKLFVSLIALLLVPTAVAVGQYTSDFDRQPDRVWLGPDLWANPMEDWQVHDGRLECATSAPDRNVQLLTQQLDGRKRAFTASVRLGVIEGNRGAAGLTVGIHDEINDYRGNLFFGHGIRAWITTADELVLAGTIVKLASRSDLNDVTLRLDGKPEGGQYALRLVATDTASGKPLGKATARVPSDWVIGNIALAHNPPVKIGNPNARFWFNDWSVSGDKIDDHPDQRFGPILFAMHTLNDTRTADGHVMKITAQMPPLGEADSQEVRLEADYGEGFKTLGTREDRARLAHRHVPRGTLAGRPRRALPPSLRAEKYRRPGERLPVDRHGAPRPGRPPAGRARLHGPLLPGLSLHAGRSQRGAAEARPAVLLRRPDLRAQRRVRHRARAGRPGDPLLPAQVVPVRLGVARACSATRRPSACPTTTTCSTATSGAKAGPSRRATDTSSSGGYVEPVRMVNVVHRTNSARTSPTRSTPTPVLRGMTVYYGEMVYGRVSFAMLADRQFKSGPENVEDRQPPRRLGRRARLRREEDRQARPEAAGRPPAQVPRSLGGRLARRRHEGRPLADRLCQRRHAPRQRTTTTSRPTSTPAAGPSRPATGPSASCARATRCTTTATSTWPRSSSTASMRPRDSNWSFCTPAVCSVYQRWWEPDRMGRPHTDRPALEPAQHGRVSRRIGQLDLRLRRGQPPVDRPGQRRTATSGPTLRAGGFANVIVDTAKRTYTCQCYHFLADLRHPKPGDQFAGWPLTIQQKDNYGRHMAGHLPEVSVDGVRNAVLQVYNQKTGELVYALRLTTNHVKPWVFEPGTYTVKLGDPDTGKWKTFTDQTLARTVGQSQ